MAGFFDGISSFFGGVKGLASTAKTAATLFNVGASVYNGITGARDAKKNAKLIRQQSEREADLKRRQTRRLVGQQRANFAAAGIQIEGSPALLIEETEQLGEEEAQNILQYGNAQAKAYKSQGTNALIGSGLSAGAGLLGGFAQNQLFNSKLKAIS
ncbi:hypothetical protein [Kiloniella majae]|uniref:hypothetical protein n=1 Tax=Kiloniella majae TaxID=1938558 RepID=UPI000A277BB2|nr:hypothetical protein [Kiloniella majae]